MFTMIAVVVLIAVLCAWVMAISLFISAKGEKGYSSEGNGMLWFVGIFATPIVVGLYVASLPDKGASSSTASQARDRDELPEV